MSEFLRFTGEFLDDFCEIDRLAVLEESGEFAPGPKNRDSRQRDFDAGKS